MRRLILPALLALAGCATSPPPAIQLASSSDPALMESFFGAGSQRAISPVIRCPVRCQAVQ